MSSDIDICNLALSHLGDSASVSSIDPPEGSAQAEHCARWYPIARDTLLSSHAWNFASKRASLASLEYEVVAGWTHAYALPSDCLEAVAILDPNSTGDYTENYANQDWHSHSGYPLRPSDTARDYVIESGTDGVPILFTNQQYAVLRYVYTVTDTTRFTPIVANAISWLLASYLAGPVVKGMEGAQMARACLQAYENVELPKAKMHDARQRRVKQDLSPNWIKNR